jgi:hypothetical protein
VLSPRLIATGGFGGTPRHVAMGGLWPAPEPIREPVGGGGIILPRRKRPIRRPARGEIHVEALAEIEAHARLILPFARHLKLAAVPSVRIEADSDLIDPLMLLDLLFDDGPELVVSIRLKD